MSTLKNIFSALAGTFSGKRAEKSASASKVTSKINPPVDLNVPVTNPRLVAAIFKHQKCQTNETAVELFGEMKNAILLAGIILEKPPTPTTEAESVFVKGDKIGFVEVIDNNEKRLLALFTDHSELQSFTNQANSTLVMPPKDAMSFVLDKEYDGFVINPAGKATLRLDAPFIRDVINDM